MLDQFEQRTALFMLQMTHQGMGPSLRMLGMVPLVLADGDIASDTCASQGTAFQHVCR